MPEATWQKSSYCAQGNSCIHIATTPTNTIHLTESSDPAHSTLGATPHAFAALIHVLKESPTHV
ncbi:hypothetical protein QF026_004182 [Streptomyces aurantiacus]|uniref:DUF397 domain-containing protein n=1 Tax=Streptomyces aurantiacus TaxID=47760 RepID=UPI002792F367|nr:DUF397 domain-containing protein [Streptomyces aurantiacus]MDQ0775716.1 hypothetical protein [Streptomyces aurantiacus]